MTASPKRKRPTERAGRDQGEHKVCMRYTTKLLLCVLTLKPK